MKGKFMLLPNCSETTWRLEFKLDFTEARSNTGKVLNSLKEGKIEDETFEIYEDASEANVRDRLAEQIIDEINHDEDLDLHKIKVKILDREGDPDDDYAKEILNEILYSINENPERMKEIYPNCSEIVWRLNIPQGKPIDRVLRGLKNEKNKTSETWTDSFPNGGLDEMVGLLQEAKKDGFSIDDIEIEYVDNSGGGGNWNYVEECFNIAKKCAQKKITKKQAEKLDDDLWNGKGKEADDDGAI